MPQSDSSTGPRIFFSAGEPSGDFHAANLAKALKTAAPGAEFAALGGPSLEAAGARLLTDMVGRFSVMGFVDALAVVPAIRRVRNEALEFIDSWRPDAAILVDYPGFNMNLAAFLKRRGVPVFYYICPQVWAWARGRVRKIRKRVDRALVVFEFEREFFASHGVDATYVGHPLGDLFAARGLDEEFMADGLLSGAGFVVALAPGSRLSEIRGGFPVKAAVAKRIKEVRTDAVFAVPVLKDEHAEIVKRIAREAGLECFVFVGKTHEVMAMADFALATSGTATLELAHFDTPMVVLYRTNPGGLLLKRLFLKIPHISLVNIIAGREVVPEYVYWRKHEEIIAKAALDIITDEKRYQKMRVEIREVAEAINSPGASAKAAGEILSWLARRRGGAG